MEAWPPISTTSAVLARPGYRVRCCREIVPACAVRGDCCPAAAAAVCRRRRAGVLSAQDHLADSAGRGLRAHADRDAGIALAISHVARADSARDRAVDQATSLATPHCWGDRCCPRAAADPGAR